MYMRVTLTYLDSLKQRLEFKTTSRFCAGVYFPCKFVLFSILRFSRKRRPFFLCGEGGAGVGKCSILSVWKQPVYPTGDQIEIKMCILSLYKDKPSTTVICVYPMHLVILLTKPISSHNTSLFAECQTEIFVSELYLCVSLKHLQLIK